MSELLSLQPNTRSDGNKISHQNCDHSLNQLKKLRSSNFPLINKSLRGKLTCFNDLDLDGYEVNKKTLLNFISNGPKQCSMNVLTPMPINWPTKFDDLIDEIRVLDIHIIKSDFHEKPVKWLLKTGLAQLPRCNRCTQPMKVGCERYTFIWKCDNQVQCSIYALPILRSTFFNEFQHISLDKILYCLYYWSICTSPSELVQLMHVDIHILNALWRKLQNVCRVAIERAYPKYRFHNIVPLVDESYSEFQPIELISIKVNKFYIVCAKHPNSNMVRLGLVIPSVSTYDFAGLVESWFASGTCVRVCEPRFLALRERREDLRIELVSRSDMIGKQGYFDSNSAFGYLLTQLGLVFKDYNSRSISCEQMKLLLAELQWRELYGNRPITAFESIVNHIVSYGVASKTYKEFTSRVVEKTAIKQYPSGIRNDYVWVEEYFYATIELITKKSISRLNSIIEDRGSQPQINQINDMQQTQNGCIKPDVRIRCHNCDCMFETYDFGIHAVMHVEEARRLAHRTNSMLIDGIEHKECRHCFRLYDIDSFEAHVSMYRFPELDPTKYGCRICCLKLPDRSSYLQHMRRYHFQYECPYRCPSCDYASSFQRDIFEHFQEEHRHQMTVLCPLCLKGFTVLEPNNLNIENMHEISTLVHDHMSEHYAMQKQLTCDSCCLSFINKKYLFRHRARHHNPMEIIDTTKCYIGPFRIQDSKMESWCTKALELELYIANKRPNIQTDESFEIPDESGTIDNQLHETNLNVEISQTDIRSSQSENIIQHEEVIQPEAKTDAITAKKTEQALNEVRNFISGGVPALICPIPRYPLNRLSSAKLIDALSKLPKADGIKPNVSVLLSPFQAPVTCNECKTPITCDHYVELIKCPNKGCGFCTHCPRYMLVHQAHHQSNQPNTKTQLIVGKSRSLKLSKLNTLNEEMNLGQAITRESDMNIASTSKSPNAPTSSQAGISSEPADQTTSENPVLLLTSTVSQQVESPSRAPANILCGVQPQKTNGVTPTSTSMMHTTGQKLFANNDQYQTANIIIAGTSGHQLDQEQPVNQENKLQIISDLAQQVLKNDIIQQEKDKEIESITIE